MSFQSYTRNPSGVVFFGADGSETLYTSASTFTYDDGLNALKIPNGGYIGSQSDYDAISIASNGNVSLTQNLSVAGNLTVNGSTTTVNTTNLDVKDSLVMISSGTATPANDAGILIDRGSLTNAFMGWDESADKFIVGTTTADSNSTGDLSITAGTLVADLEGNADSATQLASSQNFSLTGQVSASNVSFDGTGGVALSTSLGVTAITGQSTVTEAPSDAYIIMASGSALQKITKSNFVSDLGAMSSFTLAGTTGSSSVVDGDTLTIAASSQGMVSVAVSADTASISVTSAIADGTKNITFDSSNGIGIADAGLNSIAGLTTAANKMIYTTGSDTYAVTDLSAFGRSLIDDADASAARTTLGLVIGTNVQAYDAQLADVAGLTPTDGNFIVGDGTNFVTEAGATARTSLGLGSIATQNSIDLASDVTGALPIANGGTGATTESDARTNLGLAIGTDVQAYDADLSAIAALAKADGNIIVGNGTTWVAEAGATARASLGLTIGTDVQAYDADTAKYDDTTANFTGTLQNGGSNVVVDSDIGSTVQAYDADTAKYDDATANFTGTLQNGGSNVVVDSDIGSTVQAYDAQLADVAGLSTTDGGFIVGNGSNFVIETGATARTSLGLGSLATLSSVDTAQLADGAVTEAKRDRTVHSLSTNGGADKDITLVTTSSTNKTVYLPASPSTGQLVMIKKIDSGAGAVIVNASGSTIDDASTKNLYGQYESLSAIYNGSEWFVV